MNIELNAIPVLASMPLTQQVLMVLDEHNEMSEQDIDMMTLAFCYNTKAVEKSGVTPCIFDLFNSNNQLPLPLIWIQDGSYEIEVRGGDVCIINMINNTHFYINEEKGIMYYGRDSETTYDISRNAPILSNFDRNCSAYPNYFPLEEQSDFTSEAAACLDNHFNKQAVIYNANIGDVCEMGATTTRLYNEYGYPTLRIETLGMWGKTDYREILGRNLPVKVINAIANGMRFTKFAYMVNDNNVISEVRRLKVNADNHSSDTIKFAIYPIPGAYDFVHHEDRKHERYGMYQTQLEKLLDNYPSRLTLA